MKSTASAPTTLPLLKLRPTPLTVLIRHQAGNHLVRATTPTAYRQLLLNNWPTSFPKLIPLMCKLNRQTAAYYGDGQNVALRGDHCGALDVVINRASQGNL